MSRFFFDVFDGTTAVRDDFGDVFSSVDDAADQAAGLLVDFAREAVPLGLARDFGVIVRDGDRDVYHAVLSFRAAMLDGWAPPPPLGRGPVPSIPEPADLVRQSQATRAASRDLRRQHILQMAEWSATLNRALDSMRAAVAATA